MFNEETHIDQETTNHYLFSMFQPALLLNRYVLDKPCNFPMLYNEKYSWHLVFINSSKYCLVLAYKLYCEIGWGIMHIQDVYEIGT